MVWQVWNLWKPRWGFLPVKKCSLSEPKYNSWYLPKKRTSRNLFSCKTFAELQALCEKIHFLYNRGGHECQFWFVCENKNSNSWFQPIFLFTFFVNIWRRLGKYWNKSWRIQWEKHVIIGAYFSSWSLAWSRWEFIFENLEIRQRSLHAFSS